MRGRVLLSHASVICRPFEILFASRRRLARMTQPEQFVQGGQPPPKGPLAMAGREADSRPSRERPPSSHQSRPLRVLPMLIIAGMPRLRRFAAAMIGDEGAADLLVQEMLALTLADPTELPEDQEISVSLFTILYQMRLEAIEVLDPHPVPAMTPSFESVLFQNLPGADRDELKEFAQAIGSLREEDRAILLLISLENFSYRDIGMIVGLPAGRIMSKLARARQHLHTTLKDNAAQRTIPSAAGPTT